MLDIIRAAPRRVVGYEGEFHAQPAQQLQKRIGAVKNGMAVVNCAIQVEQEMNTEVAMILEDLETLAAYATDVEMNDKLVHDLLQQRLRDRGQLSLDAHVADLVPSFAKLRLPTADSRPITGLPLGRAVSDGMLATTRGRDYLTRLLRYSISARPPAGLSARI